MWCHSGLYHSAECHFDDCHYADCHSANCHFVLCHYTKCYFASAHNAHVIMLSVIMLSVIMLSVIILSAVMVSIQMPRVIHYNEYHFTNSKSSYDKCQHARYAKHHDDILWRIVILPTCNLVNWLKLFSLMRKEPNGAGVCERKAHSDKHIKHQGKLSECANSFKTLAQLRSFSSNENNFVVLTKWQVVKITMRRKMSSCCFTPHIMHRLKMFLRLSDICAKRHLHERHLSEVGSPSLLPFPLT